MEGGGGGGGGGAGGCITYWRGGAQTEKIHLFSML